MKMLQMLIEVVGVIIIIPAYLALSVVITIGAIGLLCYIIESGEWSLLKRIVASTILLALLPVVLVCFPGMIVAESLFSKEIANRAEKLFGQR